MDQEDLDTDGIGDICDTCVDVDGDGWGFGTAEQLSTCPESTTVADNCPSDPNPDQANADGDSEGDVCDSGEECDGLDNDGDTLIDETLTDVDDDGICDERDDCIDSDDDGYADPGATRTGCAFTDVDDNLSLIHI